MTMSRSRLTTALVAGLAGLLAAHAHAGGAEDIGPRIVVPYVSYEATETTRVFIQNHEVDPVQVILRYVGARGSATPGLQLCRPGGSNLVLPAFSVTELDLTD